jgi:UDP-N-acetylglucosamine 2-epimerase (non-hydrolysing)
LAHDNRRTARSGAPGRLAVLLLYGTRPEAIKMAPVAAALRARPRRFSVTLCTTAQHREMLDQVQALFGLAADVDLDLMRPDQSLNDLASRLFAALDPVLVERRPDWLLVQGDTTSALVGALAAFHRGVKVGHVEAGLRTGHLRRPFPEEANRRAIDLVADALFAPTERACQALLAEGVDPGRVFLTGNTVVDALTRIAADRSNGIAQEPERDEVLVTIHRRETFGAPLCEIFAALRELAAAFPATRFVYPVHRNPNVREPAYRLLSGIPNLELHEPFDYLTLLRRLAAARLVITDSGGLQEEAPAFGRPVLVLREETERPEGIEAGLAELAGTCRQRIVAAATRLLRDEGARGRMAAKGAVANPYGDGRAAERIAACLAGEPFTPFVAIAPAAGGR